MLTRIHGALVTRISPGLLGRHPRNTFFSFNFHNVRHITAFLMRSAERLPAEGMTFLDIGAGACPYHALFASRAARYIAIDTADGLPGDDSRGIEFMLGSAESLPLPDATADCVLFNQVLEHVADPDRSLSEISRVLKPGGWLLGSVPHISPVHLEPHDYRRYTDLGLRELLERHKFAEIIIEGNGGVYCAAALLLTMDWMLSRRREGQPQEFSANRAFWLSPVVGLVNLSAQAADALFGDKGRSPANLCLAARNSSDS
jgi:SAM-dependent methyltransferase